MEDDSRKFQPTAGVRTDFEKLLKLFTDTGTVRYENFVEKWNDMKMHLFCSGRQSDREVREFMEDCMKIALPFCLPPFNFQLRVGALYLLYGLFNTQPCLPRVKIRVTCKNWKEINDFQNEARRQQHLDVAYVFHKLRLQQAFHFVATKSEIALAKNTRENQDEASTLSETFKEQGQHLKQLFTTDVLEQLTAVHHQYHLMKTALAGPGASRPDQSLNVVQEELVPNVTRLLMLHQEKHESVQQGSRKGKRKMEEDDDYSDIDPTYVPGMEAKESDVGQLKAKAFGKVAKTSRSRRHRQVTAEMASPMKSPAKSPKGGRSKASAKRSNPDKNFDTDLEKMEEKASMSMLAASKGSQDDHDDGETITVVDTVTGNETYFSMPKIGDTDPVPQKKGKAAAKSRKSTTSKVKLRATLEIESATPKKAKKQKSAKVKKEKKSPTKRKGKNKS